MEHLPKVVQSQFKKGLRVSAESHPDANLLAAFSEQSLTDSERTIVLAHISSCAECRDIIFLSAPEAAAPAIQIRPASFWRPVLVWSGVAACVLIISGVALLRHAESEKRVETALKQEAPVVTMQRDSVPASVQPLTPEKDLAKTTTVKTIQAKPTTKDSSNLPASRYDYELAKISPSSPAEASAVGGTKKAEPSADSSQLSEAKSAPAAAASPVSAMRAANNTGMQSVNAQSAPQGGPVLMKESFADTVNANGAMVGKLKLDTSPRWTLNSDGTLLRSVDTGASWKKIIIPGNAATLRTIATVGPDVWVGGTEGAIYHSNDAGSHWMPVSLTDEGMPLSDDVISIKFASPQQGTILTGHQAVWTTDDGGLTWNKK